MCKNTNSLNGLTNITFSQSKNRVRTMTIVCLTVVFIAIAFASTQLHILKLDTRQVNYFSPVIFPLTGVQEFIFSSDFFSYEPVSKYGSYINNLTSAISCSFYE